MCTNLRMVMKSFALMSLMLFLATACGDLLGNKVVKKKLESKKFRADCDLDVNAFTDILKRNISSDILCLQENLDLFIKVVKTDRPGTLGRVALEQFVIKNRPDIKPEMVRAMKAIFDLNYLVTGEDPEYISSESMHKLVNFALLLNEKASHHWSTTFGSKVETPWSIYQIQRQTISESARAIVVSLRKIFREDRSGKEDRLNLLDLMDNFTTEDNREDLEKVKKLLFVKKILLGGSKEELTHLELERLLLNLEPLLTIALDGIRFQYITMGQSSLVEMLNRDVNDLSDLIFQGELGNRDRMVLFTMDDVEDAIRLLVDKSDFDVDKFSNLMRSGKQIVMGGNTNDIKGEELKTLFNHGKTVLKTGLAFHGFYRDFNIVMESPLPVTLNFDEYRHTYPQYQKELTNFDRIVKKYRFFKGEFQSPYFTSGYKRNADAIYEVYLIEYVIKILMQTYGAPSPNADNPFGYSIDQFQMQAVFKKYKKDLVALDLVSPLWPTITADNVSLLGTLFQFQSDKNKVMDVNEATEFAVSLITSLEMTDEMFDYYKKTCGANAFDQFGRLDPECMRQNFFPAMCDGYRPYMPLFFSSINTPKYCKDLALDAYTTQYLDRAARAARPCMNYTDGNKEEIWYTKADVSTMLMVVLHAETTVLRWDTNNNNTLDVNEVNAAYDIYNPALDGFLETRPAIIKKFKKQIYQYLVKYEEVPDDKQFKSILKFIKFLLSFNKSSTATRKTIVSVLKSIGDENAKLPTAPKIDCNYLRDPDNIPSLQEKTNGPSTDNRPDYSGLLEGYLHLID